jgi:hypothetical protein
VASVAMQCKHLESSDQPLAFGHRSVKEHIRDFAGQWPLKEIGSAISRAPTSYVEVTSFKLIPFSAFWAKWRRVACKYRKTFP